MSNVKYQIFISSTYTDLKSERGIIVKACLEMGHIPVGMEMVVPSDEELWKVTARHIEQSDYFVVILANRYGSLCPDGKSYVEREYDYAISVGIPILAFVSYSDESNTGKKPSNISELEHKLENFRRKLFTRPVQMWRNSQELDSLFKIALAKAIASNPRRGWQAAAQKIESISLNNTIKFSVGVLVLSFTISLVIALINGGGINFETQGLISYVLKRSATSSLFLSVTLAIALALLVQYLYRSLRLEFAGSKVEGSSNTVAEDKSEVGASILESMIAASTKASKGLSTLVESPVPAAESAKLTDVRSKEFVHQMLADEFDATQNRLLKEINKIENRGFLNLVIGIVTTLTAIAVLAVSIIGGTPDQLDINSLLKYYIPKITFSVFVEIFAFFFLRLYRASLIDIKYYQNELTNLNMKAVALKLLLLQDGSEALSQVCVETSKTERNAILKDNEALSITSSAKNETGSDKYFGDIIQKLIDKIPKPESASDKK